MLLSRYCEDFGLFSCSHLLHTFTFIICVYVVVRLKKVGSFIGIIIYQAPLGMPKWVWPFMYRYKMFFVQTSTLPPRMCQKLTKHRRFCKQNNQLPNKSHDELEDNSNSSRALRKRGPWEYCSPFLVWHLWETQKCRIIEVSYYWGNTKTKEIW
jgi:hypothetical protein